MAEFVVKVADERGHISEQVESAHTEAEARDRYSQQGYLVYSVRPRGLLGVREGGRWRFRRKVKLEHFVIFNEQFVTLIHAGHGIAPIRPSAKRKGTHRRDPKIVAAKGNGFRRLFCEIA